MVHALSELRAWLRPGGQLIDLHPTGDAPHIEVVLEGRHHFAGYLQEADDGAEYGLADAAVARALGQGWYRQTRAERIWVQYHFESVADLCGFLAASWHDARVDQPVLDRLRAWMDIRITRPRLVIRERLRLARLEPAELRPE